MLLFDALANVVFCLFVSSVLGLESGSELNGWGAALFIQVFSTPTLFILFLSRVHEECELTR